MRLLFLGDIVGRPGRSAVFRSLNALKAAWDVDLVVANGENASGGIGLTAQNAAQLHAAGVDVITSGNHIWKHKDILSCLDSEAWILRPANYPPGVPGRGWGVYSAADGEVAVINLLGRIFMDPIDCPFRTVECILAEVSKQARHILVDFHAEATSEKKAMLYALRGRVSAVIGTHTHVPTADAHISPQHTGYITDAGMCGPFDSIIGMQPEPILERLRTGLPQAFTVGKGEVVLQGAFLETDAQGRAVRFVPVQEFPK